MSFNIYVGPCFEVPPTTRVVLGTVRSCEKGHTFSKHSVAFKYCTECGTEVKDRPTSQEVVAPPRTIDLPEKLANLVWSPDHAKLPDSRGAVWLPNSRGFGQTFSETQESPPVEFEGTHVAVELSRFIHKHKELVDFVKERLQLELKAKFMVVPYYA